MISTKCCSRCVKLRRKLSVIRHLVNMFDHEFQNFFKGFLDILFTYFDDPSKDAELNGGTFDNSRSWQLSVLNTCISYYFDVLLHYKESAALDNWTTGLANLLLS